MLVYTAAFIDRQVLNLVVEPMKRSLLITDTQMSLLQGAAFTVAYVIFSPIMGRLADRANRRNVLLAAVCVWSLATAAGGMADSFWGFFASRVGVGAAEAAVTPIAWSMLTDYFSRERLPRAMSFFLVGPYVGAGLALIFGGLLIGVAQSIADAVPILAGREPWQIVFIVIGLPGLLLGASMLVVREPARRAVGRRDERGAEPWRGRALFLVGPSVFRPLLQRDGRHHHRPVRPAGLDPRLADAAILHRSPHRRFKLRNHRSHPWNGGRPDRAGPGPMARATRTGRRDPARGGTGRSRSHPHLARAAARPDLHDRPGRGGRGDILLQPAAGDGGVRATAGVAAAHARRRGGALCFPGGSHRPWRRADRGCTADRLCLSRHGYGRLVAGDRMHGVQRSRGVADIGRHSPLSRGGRTSRGLVKTARDPLGPLFDPVTVAGLSLRNRWVMAPMTRWMSPDQTPGLDVAEYYARRARHGVGLIITEGTTVDHPVSSYSERVPAFHGAALDSWRRVVDRVHTEGGKVVPQLWHVGAMRHPSNDYPNRHLPNASPSGLFKPGGKQIAEPLTSAEIQSVIDSFVRGAVAARSIGVDGVEIHGAHGYLLDQFLWEPLNTRDDQFGGDAIARTEFAVRLVEAVRAAIGSDFPLILRVSQWKQQDYDARLADTPEMLRSIFEPIAAAGVDIFHCSQRRWWQTEFEGSPLNFAGWMRKLLGRPVITVGSVGMAGAMSTVDVGEASKAVADLQPLAHAVQRGDFDLVAVGRALLADPAWVEKVRLAQFDRLVPFDKAALDILA